MYKPWSCTRIFNILSDESYASKQPRRAENRHNAFALTEHTGVPTRTNCSGEVRACKITQKTPTSDNFHHFHIRYCDTKFVTQWSLSWRRGTKTALILCPYYPQIENYLFTNSNSITQESKNSRIIAFV